MTRPKRAGEGLKPVTVILPAEALARVQAIAERTVTPVSVLLRQWIMERIEQLEGEGQQ